jgi:hypothetical protein
MIIEAGRIFRCTHSYVAVKDGGIMVFACLTCGYRTELLPIRSKGPASSVIAFPAVLTGGRISEPVMVPVDRKVREAR